MDQAEETEGELRWCNGLYFQGYFHDIFQRTTPVTCTYRIIIIIFLMKSMITDENFECIKINMAIICNLCNNVLVCPNDE